MRVLLVGCSAERARLRAELGGAVTIVGEFETMRAARDSGVAADAILVEAGPEGPAVRGSEGPAVRKSDGPPQEALTAREVEVIELMAEGLPNKAIALRLGISDQTVKFHVATILGKLGATNRTDAVRRAVGRGLITL